MSSYNQDLQRIAEDDRPVAKSATHELSIHPQLSKDWGSLHNCIGDLMSWISEDIEISEEIRDRCIHDSIISGLLTNDDTKEERVQTMNTMEEEIGKQLLLNYFPSYNHRQLIYR